MDIELAGFIIKGRDNDVLARRYFLDEYDLNVELYELPIAVLGLSEAVDQALVGRFNQATDLNIQVLEKHAATELHDPGVAYRCHWLSACAHNPNAMYKNPEYEWRFLNFEALKIGRVALGPHTEKLAQAIRNEEIRLK